MVEWRRGRERLDVGIEGSRVFIKPTLVVAVLFTLVLSATTASAQAANSGHLYVLNQKNAVADEIYGFEVDESTGGLTALPSFPVDAGGSGGSGSLSEQLAVDPVNKRLYVINDGSHDIGAFSIDAVSGALTPLPFSPIALGGSSWATVRVHPSGSPVVAGDSGAPAGLASFQVTAITATPAVGSPYSPTGAVPFSSVFTQDGAYVYTGGNLGNAFAGFSVDAATGVLSPLAGSPFNSGELNPVAMATDLSGRLLLANAGGNHVRAFTLAAGVPTAVTGNPFPSGLGTAVQSVRHPNGFLMVADRSAGSKVGVFRIAGSGLATTLTPVAGSPFAAGGTFTDAVALNDSGNFLFALNGTSRNITTFSVNGSTGELTSPTTQPLNTMGASGQLTGIGYLAYSSPVTPPSTSSPSSPPVPSTVTLNAVNRHKKAIRCGTAKKQCKPIRDIVRLAGRVAPVRSAAPERLVSTTLEQKVGKNWRLRRTLKPSTDISTGDFTAKLTAKMLKRGEWRVRSSVASTATAESATSQYLLIKVK